MKATRKPSLHVCLLTPGRSYKRKREKFVSKIRHVSVSNAEMAVNESAADFPDINVTE